MHGRIDPGAFVAGQVLYRLRRAESDEVGNIVMLEADNAREHAIEFAPEPARDEYCVVIEAMEFSTRESIYSEPACISAAQMEPYETNTETQPPVYDCESDPYIDNDFDMLPDDGTEPGDERDAGYPDDLGNDIAPYDAGYQADSGATQDIGREDANTTAAGESGCGCSAGPYETLAPGGFWALLMGMALFGRRRMVRKS